MSLLLNTLALCYSDKEDNVRMSFFSDPCVLFQDELEKELEELEQEELDKELLGTGPTADQLPSVPSEVPVPAARAKTSGM